MPGVALALALWGTACTEVDEAARRSTPATVSGTGTDVDVDADADADADAAGTGPESLPPGPSPESVRASIEAAVAARDACALVAAVDQPLPQGDDPAAVVAVYRELLEAVRSGRDVRPPELGDVWTELIGGVTAGVDALVAAGGDLDAPAVTAAFTADALQAAVRAVRRWSQVHCPAT